MLSQLPILLEHVNNFIDLGVTISKILSWSNDIKKIMDKVSKVLHYIKFLLGTLMQMFFPHCTFPLYVQSWNTWYLPGSYLAMDTHPLRGIQGKVWRTASVAQRGDIMWRLLKFPTLLDCKTYFIFNLIIQDSLWLLQICGVF